MSNTIVRDCNPEPKPGDNALVIVVGEDGTLSVDPETLSSLLNKGGNSTEVSIVRMSGTDPISNTVDATLETFFETNSVPTPISIEKSLTPRNIMEELKVDVDEVDEITRLCRNVHMDHCYTPLTSPSQKLPPRRDDDGIETTDSSVMGGSLVQSQTLNKSTEDLMAVLEADNEPVKPPTPAPPPQSTLITPQSVQPSVVKVNKVDTDVNRIATTQPSKVLPTAATLVQTINKNFQNLTSLSKKTVKIVTVTKPPTGVRSAALGQVQQVKPTLAVREPVVKKEPPPQKEVDTAPIEIPPSTNSTKSLDEDLSDISSDSDFEMDDDSDDSDFDAGRQKISKPKYKTFGSQRGRSSAARARRDRTGAKITPNRQSSKAKKLNASNKESPKTSGKTKVGKNRTKAMALTPEKEEPIIAQETLQTPEKQAQDQAKKQAKKKVVKPVGLFDDGIALFSTPDVIRRVSVGGKSDTTESPPIKADGKLSRTSSTEQKLDSHLDSFNHSHDKVQNSNKDMTDSSSTPTVSTDDKSIESKQIAGVDSTTLDATEQNLAALDNANLDLDLNTDELIPEDLLFQVAKLVENADIQKVIDTNLNLVDQNLGNLESVLPKSEEDSNYANKDFNHTEHTTSISSTKELENIMTGNTNSSSIQTPHKLQNTSQQKILSNTGGGALVAGTITKNTTNKPIQIVRPDGRVIIIPPIEKPATRSSKRKQTNEPTNIVTTSPVPVPPPAKSINNLTSTPPVQKITPATIQRNTPSITTPEYEKKSQKLDISGFDEVSMGGMGGGDDSEMSDSDESWKSEDDPDRLWCICKQPHNNRFMICCDTCEEWFHGQCVGVSKALGRQMEQQGKEWQCPNCQKAKKTALQHALNEAQATMTLSPPTPEAQLDPDKPIQRCIVCKGPSRSGSVYCSEKCIVQHSNAVERVIVFERATGRCLSGTNAPTVANLKQWLKQHPGFEVVSSGNKTLTQPKLPTNKIPKISGQTQPGKVTKQPSTEQQQKPPPQILNHQLNKVLHQKSSQMFYGKQQQNVQAQPTKSSPTTAIPLKVQQLKQGVQPAQKTAKLIQPHTMVIKQPGQIKAKPPTPTTPQPPKVSTQEENKKKSTPANKSTVTPQKISRTKSTSSITADEKQTPPSVATKGPEQLRENVRKTLAEHFTIRLKEQDEIKMTEEEVKTLSNEIEAELFALFNRDTGAKYRNRYRSLIFNIKDTKNETLWRRICSKAVTPKELVRLSPEELASQELAQWRERETKHQLDMIKKTELDLLSCVRTYVLKSHKGEEVIEKKVDAVDSTIVADLDGSLNEGRLADSTSERTPKLSSQDSIFKESSRTLDEKEKHDKHRKDSSSSSSKHKRDRSRDRSRERSSRKHRDGSRDRKKRSRSRDRSRDRRRDISKDRRSLDSKKRHRSRSGSRHKSTDRDHKNRHKHKDHDRHKSSRHKHSSSKHKDSESDSTSSSIVKNSSKENNKTESGDLLTMGLDKKSKEILESLVDNKVVDDRILKAVEEPQTVLPVPADSESDHEPSSTVTINTPPRNIEPEPVQTEKTSALTPLETVIPEATTPDDNSDTSETTIKKTVVSKPPLPPAPLTSADGPIVWRGFINMVDVAKFRITAQEVSGDCVGLASELPAILDIVGRISPDTVWEYLSKMRRSTAKYISILRLMAESGEEQSAYQSLYTYLSSRKRFGVVKTANTSIKDFYIMPQASYNPLPQVLLPLNGPGFEEARPNLLLGILVSSKRKRPQTIYETPPQSKKARESPPRSYTPPPTNIIKDPRMPQRNLVSSIAMPPLPTVAPIPTEEFQKPEPPPLDDLDEPYSPGDSDDTLPTIPVNIISKPKPTVTREKEKPVVRPPPAKEPPASDLSILEPFKTSNFSSIPGLDTAAPIADSANSTPLGVSSLLSGALTSTTTTSLETPTTPLTSETDLDTLQRNIDEINKRIERERQEIDSISMGIVQKEDLESSCLANIALPSNLRQILDSIKTKKSDEKEDVTPVTTKTTKSAIEEYLPSTLPSTSANYTPSTSTKDSISSEDSLPTIPLLLPKIPRSSIDTKSSTNISDLNIPLNLPIPKRTFSPATSIKRSLDSPELVGDYKRKHFDSPSDKKMELPQIPLKFPLISKKTYSTSTPIKSETKDAIKEEIKEIEQSDSKPSSVLSSLSAEDLIRKANEMLAAQSDVKDGDEDEDVEDEDDDEPYDPETTEPTEAPAKVTSIKQAPVLYPNTSIPPPNMRYIPNLEQPPVPGLEDYE